MTISELKESMEADNANGLSKAGIVYYLLLALGDEWHHCGNIARDVYFKHMENRGELVIKANGRVGVNSIYTAPRDWFFFSPEQTFAIGLAAAQIRAYHKGKEYA